VLILQSSIIANYFRRHVWVRRGCGRHRDAEKWGNMLEEIAPENRSRFLAAQLSDPEPVLL
jgi:hypothetical protein